MAGLNQTKLYALLGFPLSHSFSKKYFEEKFLNENISDCRYENFAIENISSVKKILASQNDLHGLNVTIPHKQSIISLLDEIDVVAKEIGAVNCIKITDGKWKGYNTDAFGFEMSIKPFLENKYERALILGTGGASKAISYVLKGWGIEFYNVSRHPKSAREIRYIDLSEESMKHFPLIINTTPIGTFPKVDEVPMLPYNAITDKHFLYDLIYNPAETPFLKKGKQAGAHTMNGLKMLELQAERSWEIWNDLAKQ